MIDSASPVDGAVYAVRPGSRPPRVIRTGLTLREVQAFGYPPDPDRQFMYEWRNAMLRERIEQ